MADIVNNAVNSEPIVTGTDNFNSQWRDLHYKHNITDSTTCVFFICLNGEIDPYDWNAITCINDIKATCSYSGIISCVKEYKFKIL